MQTKYPLNSVKCHILLILVKHMHLDNNSVHMLSKTVFSSKVHCLKSTSNYLIKEQLPQSNTEL